MSSDANSPRRSFGARAARFWKPDVPVEVDDEIRFHIDERIADLVSSGLNAQSAREQAEREFGDTALIRQQMLRIDNDRDRSRRRRDYLGQLRQDLRISMRSLRRSPAFTATAIACIALGICVTTTIFGAVYAILLRPLPYVEPDRLVSIYSDLKERNLEGVNISWPDYVSWKERNSSFIDVGIWTWSTLSLSGNGEAERIESADVSASVFPLLGVQPILGRLFTTDEERVGNHRVILLSHDVWKSRYAGDSSIVGKTVLVNAQAYAVVGIMPPRFNFPERAQAWRPFAVDPALEARENRGYAGAIARLKPGITLQSATADLEVISRQLASEYPQQNRGWTARLVDLRTDLTGDFRRPLMVFLGAVGLVLLIASANVANLMFARGASRRQETAVRMALGAGRGRIVRAVLAESLLLSTIGGALGLLLTVSGLRLVERVFPFGTPFYISLSIDYRVAAFAIALSACTALLFGWLPAISSTRLDVQRSLRDGARSGGGQAHGRTRRGLVIVEVALSVMLLVGAILLARSYRALLSTDLGFDRTDVLTAELSLPTLRYSTPEQRRTFATELHEKLAALPGVERVGAARGIPFSGWQVQAQVTIDGVPPRSAGDELVVHYQGVSSGYFETLRTPLLRGRMLTTADRDTANPVVVINEALAKKEFAGIDPIGRRIKFGGPASTDRWMTIVGVLEDIRQYRLPEEMGPAIYYSQSTYPAVTQTVVIRVSQGDPLVLVPALRAVVKSIDPDIPLFRIQTLDDVVRNSLWRQRMQGQILLLFAAMALVLAAVGIYGVIAWSVTQRTREVGIRMALGSSGSHVAALIIGDSMRLTLYGIVVGVGGALALSRLLESMLYQVSVFDAMTFAMAPTLLVLVAVVASWIPARRAAHVDPAVAIRGE